LLLLTGGPYGTVEPLPMTYSIVARDPAVWSAILLAKAGRIEEARDRLRMALESNERWPSFLEALQSAGVLPADSPLLASL
jgi:hypothetical protein